MVEGKLLRGDTKGRGFLFIFPNRILAKGRSRTAASKVGDEEFDQVSNVVRPQSGGVLLRGFSRVLAETG